MKNERLIKICEYINKEDKLADVGCDHGYLAILAIKKGVKYILLIDNKIGPLNSAKKNVLPYETKANIKYSLSSGISDLDNEIDTVAICGMGGELIIKILQDDFKNAKRIKKFILQANSKIDELRSYLSTNHFRITHESIVLDNDKLYEIIVAHFDEKFDGYNDLQIKFGPILMKEKCDLFAKKWMKKYEYNKEIISKLENDVERNNFILENNQIEEVLKNESE